MKIVPMRLWWESRGPQRASVTLTVLVTLLLVSVSLAMSSADHFTVKLNELRPSRTVLPGSNRATLVTHATMDESHYQAALRWCRTWYGPISVAFLAYPTNTTAEINAFVGKMQRHRCFSRYVAVHVVRYTDASASATALAANGGVFHPFLHYPFNLMRNAALDGSVGELVFLVDIDLHHFPAAEAREEQFVKNYHTVVSEAAQDTFKDPAKTIAVVPTVETVSTGMRLPTTMEGLRAGLNEHEVVAFYGHHCKNCHLPTKVERFAGGDGKPYRVSFVEGYEPYVVAHRSQLPRYDERYVGRHYNKASFFRTLAANNFSFVVWPGSFLVHQGRGGDGVGDWGSEQLRLQKLSATTLWEMTRPAAFLQNDDVASLQSDESPDPTAAASKLVSSLSHSPELKTDLVCASVATDDNSEFTRMMLERVDKSFFELGVLPRQPQARLSWLLDRHARGASLDDAVLGTSASGEFDRTRCSASGMGQPVYCRPAATACVLSDEAAQDPRVMMDVFAYLCDSSISRELCVLLERTFLASRRLRDALHVAMTVHHLQNRCLTGHSVSCEFSGHGVERPLSEVNPLFEAVAAAISNQQRDDAEL